MSSSASPFCRWQVFCLAKRGHEASEYEDAAAGDATAGRFALADGATESSYADLWAGLLVEGFVATPPRAGQPLFDWLGPLRQRWAAEVGRHTRSSWYAEMKAEQGAFAAFLGLRLRQAGPASVLWKAFAVGDCCLFQVRGGQIIRSFPLTRSGDFGNQPALLCSRPDPPPFAVEEQGDCRPEDQLWLMTDALAEWFLSRFERFEDPCAEAQLFLSLSNSAEGFANWVEELRDRQGLRNDDVTFGVVSFEDLAT